MLRKAFYQFVIAVVLIGSAGAQEFKSEVSVQGAGFFTKNSDGIENPATGAGLIGYRYNGNRWLAVEADYGYARQTQEYLAGTSKKLKANVHEITGAAVVNLPSSAKLQPFALAGGGALVFDPTGSARESFAGATQETEGTFLYGGGVDYRLTSHFALTAQYRGLVYKAPSFNLTGLNTDTWTHTAQPSTGVVFRF